MQDHPDSTGIVSGKKSARLDAGPLYLRLFA